jgi:hypothetical protein
VEEAVDPGCVEAVRRPGFGDLRAGLRGWIGAGTRCARACGSPASGRLESGPVPARRLPHARCAGRFPVSAVAVCLVLCRFGQTVRPKCGKIMG